jgi:proteasome assembly chaperone (PAC2) family protein
MEGVKVTRRPRLRNPYFIVAWPGMGDVAFKAAKYLVEKLKAEEFAQILAADFFYLSSSVIEEGILNSPELPSSKFYYWKNKGGENDLIIFISNAQPDLAKSEDYSKKILQFVKSFKIKMVISFAAMPHAIEHTQRPNIWFSATSKELINILKKYNFNILAGGQISGMNGLFLGIAKKEGFSGLCLLGEIPIYTIQIENPKASCVVLEALMKIINIKIDLNELNDQSRLMEGEINKLLDYLKLGVQTSGPIGEEEVEKIRKSLSQLTKLPVSVKEKIEKLFEQAKTDISKANELKSELDKWNVYREYEDRFLDLFKKAKDQSN